jgi:hypothetical protein
MSKKIFVAKKEDGKIYPINEEAEEEVLKMKQGKPYAVTFSSARNPKFHRMVFAVANMIIENAPHKSYWSGKDAYHFIKAVELSHGFVDEMIDCKGEVHLVPKSLAFENMEESEFKRLFDALIKEAERLLGVGEKEILINMGDFV